MRSSLEKKELLSGVMFDRCFAKDIRFDEAMRWQLSSPPLGLGDLCYCSASQRDACPQNINNRKRRSVIDTPEQLLTAHFKAIHEGSCSPLETLPRSLSLCALCLFPLTPAHSVISALSAVSSPRLFFLSLSHSFSRVSGHPTCCTKPPENGIN